MRTDAITMLAASVALLVAGCDSGQQSASQKTAAAPPATAPTKPQRDLSSLKACELVKAEEVARIAGGKLLAPPSATGPACMYVIEVAGGTEGYNIVFEPAAMVEELLKIQSGAEKGEKIAGAWDEAYLQPEPLGKGVQLVALWRGDIALEVSGERKEPIIEIAKLAASRIP